MDGRHVHPIALRPDEFEKPFLQRDDARFSEGRDQDVPRIGSGLGDDIRGTQGYDLGLPGPRSCDDHNGSIDALYSIQLLFIEILQRLCETLCGIHIVGMKNIRPIIVEISTNAMKHTTFRQFRIPYS